MSGNWSRNIAKAVLPVNRSAGKLRLFLLVLLTFIFWTFNAQTRSIPSDGFIRFNPQSSFITDVILELLGRYFHPITLLLTFMPLLLFWLARRQAAAVLSALSGLDLPQATAFLSRCAFSDGALSLEIPQTQGGISSSALPQLKALGGPAKIKINPAHGLLIKDTEKLGYQLIVNEHNTPIHYGLQHGHTLEAAFARDKLRFTFSLKEAGFPVLISFFPSQNSARGDDLAVYNLTSDDARFFVEMVQSASILKRFLRDVITTFFNRQMMSSADGNSTLSTPPPRDLPAVKPHNNYAQLHGFVQPRRKGFIRPHRFSRYPDQRLQLPHDRNIQTDYSEEESQNILNELETDIRAAMLSFFHLDQIEVIIQKGSHP